MCDEEEEPTVFIYPSDLDETLVRELEQSMNTLDHTLFVFRPAVSKTKRALEEAFEILEQCAFMIVILTPKSVTSPLLNQFIGYTLRDEKPLVTVGIGGVRGRGMISFNKMVDTGDNIEEIVSAVLWAMIEEDELDSFTFYCQKCKEEDSWDIPTAGDMIKWERSHTPLEAECSECEFINRINPRTLRPL
jgi:hypothetical protein